VYVNDKEMARISAEGSRGGLFQRRRPAQRDLSKSIEVPAGTSQVRASVTPGGRAAIVRPMNGNFQGGGSRTLEIHLSADGQVGEASLR
jgi:hypothetical protein